MNITQQKVIEQLTQRSHTNIVDSGGVFGYAWQRNQAKGEDGLKGSPYGNLDVYVTNGKLELVATKEVVHWLPEVCDYDEELDTLFHEWAKSEENKERNWFELCDEFPTYLQETFEGLEVGGIYGDGDAFTHYTYNEENCLSSDIHFTYFTLNGEINETLYCSESFIIARIHTGCDARWGFSSPVVYSEKDELSFISGYTEITVYAGDHYWDIGRNFYTESVDIFELPCIELEDVEVCKPWFSDINDPYNSGVPILLRSGEYKAPIIPTDDEHVYVYDGAAYFKGEMLTV